MYNYYAITNSGESNEERPITIIADSLSETISARREISPKSSLDYALLRPRTVVGGQESPR